MAGEGETLYTIQLGDTLGKIAAKEYGAVADAKYIQERNADRVKNINTIFEGQTIVLPAKEAVQAAKEAAKQAAAQPVVEGQG